MHDSPNVCDDPNSPKLNAPHLAGDDWADFPLPSIYTSDKVQLSAQNVDYEAALVTRKNQTSVEFDLFSIIFPKKMNQKYCIAYITSTVTCQLCLVHLAIGPGQISEDGGPDGDG